MDASVDSGILVSALDGFVYENDEFIGTEIDIEELATALFSVYEDSIFGQELGSEEVPGWTKTIAVHYSDGKIKSSDIESATIDCGINSFQGKLNFNNLDNMFDLWASLLPICAMAQAP